jgi:hypothetical protein
VSQQRDNFQESQTKIIKVEMDDSKYGKLLAKYEHACEVAVEAAELMRCAEITIKVLVKEQDECYKILEKGGYKLEAHDSLPEKLANLLVIVNSSSDAVKNSVTWTKHIKELLRQACQIMKNRKAYRFDGFLNSPEIAKLFGGNFDARP